MDNQHTDQISRRALFGRAAVFAAGGALVGAGVASGAAAAATVAQAAAHYQAAPKGKARCDNCARWLPPKSCQLVAGDISPSGWCALYAPKV